MYAEKFADRVEIRWWMLALAGLIAVVIALGTVILQALRAAMANPAKRLKME